MKARRQSKDTDRPAAMIRLHAVRNALLSLALLISLAACLPSRGQDDPEIVTGTIGGQEYFVPRAYLKLPSRALSEDNIYVLAFYPDFRPAWDSHNAIWREGKWKYNIMILAAHSSAPAPMEVHVRSTISLLHATERAGIEHDLSRFTQPDGAVKDHRDIWIEYGTENEDMIQSYTTCSEKIIERDNPQCTLYFKWYGNFFTKASFNKELLPQWREIKHETQRLLDSFRSSETAISYLRQRTVIDGVGGAR
ncbi:MAG: hypothetical protein ABTQ30_18275 [Rhizobiaceae bacterium]